MRETAVLSKKITTEDFANALDIISVTRQFDFWGDVETEVMILCFGDESLCRGYYDAKFYEDIYVGDQIDFKATLIKSGNTSRTIKLETFKVATLAKRLGNAAVSGSGMVYFDQPKLIAESISILVVRKEQQRGTQPDGTVKNPWRELED
jgi:3-aminobutyryl-CoA ammonia-lyase